MKWFSSLFFNYCSQIYEQKSKNRITYSIFCASFKNISIEKKFKFWNKFSSILNNTEIRGQL
ncbi:MAG TPA: hypothetical protein DER05_02895 [Lutibacter sp.]|nr:hypothetical protein [Lutibacter sp.]